MSDHPILSILDTNPGKNACFKKSVKSQHPSRKYHITHYLCPKTLIYEKRIRYLVDGYSKVYRNRSRFDLHLWNNEGAMDNFIRFIFDSINPLYRSMAC